jgi:hypothetical protein
MPTPGIFVRIHRNLHGWGQRSLTRQMAHPLLVRVVNDDTVFINERHLLQPRLARPRHNIFPQGDRFKALDLLRAPPRQSLAGGIGLRLHVLEVAGKIIGKIEFVIEPRGGESADQHEQWCIVTDGWRKAHGILYGQKKSKPATKSCVLVF